MGRGEGRGGEGGGEGRGGGRGDDMTWSRSSLCSSVLNKHMFSGTARRMPLPLNSGMAPALAFGGLWVMDVGGGGVGGGREG